MTSNAPSVPAPKSLSSGTFKDLLLTDGYKNSLAAALPKHVTADRMIRVVLTAMNRNPALLDCTKESLWQAVMDCASLGLEPDALGRAYLVPYGTKCQLIVGYKGLIDLAYRSERIGMIQLKAVFAGDAFDYDFGLNPKLDHKPCIAPAALTHAYSIVHIKGASMPSFDVMRKDEVDAIRARSKAANKGPWVTDYAAMAMKTVFRRHSKVLPMSAEFVHASEVDSDGFDLGAATAVAPGDRFSDDFGSAKQAEGTIVADAALTDAITGSMSNGLSGDLVLTILGRHGGGMAGTAAERAARVPADKLAACIADLKSAAQEGA